MGAVSVSSGVGRTAWIPRLVGVLAVWTLLVVLVASATPAHAGEGRAPARTAGAVAGRVTDSARHAVPGARVELLQVGDPEAEPAVVASTTTGRDGRYQLRAVPAGTYRLHVVPGSGSGLATRYWPTAPSVLQGEEVVVRAARTLRHIDVALEAESRVVGVVRDASGAAAPGVKVTAKVFVDGIGMWMPTGSATTSADGAYTIRGLPAGTYAIGFESLATPPAFLTQYYAGASYAWQATPLTLVPGTTAAGIDVSLVAPAQLSGTVKDRSGEPIPGTQVTVFVQDGAYFSTAGGAVTLADGSYVIDGLAAGAYRVSFAAPAGTSYPMLYYPGVTDFDSAASVTVDPGAHVAGVDMTFGASGGEVPGDPVQGSLRGVVRDGAGSPLPALDVYAFQAFETEWGTSWNYVRWASTGTDGAYEVSGLAPGTYRLSFVDPAGAWATTYYAGADSLDLATSVELVDGTPITGLDVWMSAVGVVGAA